jgi:hypothetical protein
LTIGLLAFIYRSPEGAKPIARWGRKATGLKKRDSRVAWERVIRFF